MSDKRLREAARLLRVDTDLALLEENQQLRDALELAGAATNEQIEKMEQQHVDFPNLENPREAALIARIRKEHALAEAWASEILRTRSAGTDPNSTTL